MPSSRSFLLKGGRVLIPASDVTPTAIDSVLDILVEDGIVKEIGPNLSADRVHDAQHQSCH